MTDLTLQVPGDKSITHRAFLFSAIAEGESRISAPLWSDDTATTLNALQDLGVEVDGDLGSDTVNISGRGLRGLMQPRQALDCGNSGTTARLLMGILAGQTLAVGLIGDESLTSRPMDRVADPLRLMGADVAWDGLPGRLPLTVTGRPLRPLDYDLPVASAQIKSAILLAGLTGGAFTLLTEPGRSRDHTERMMAAMGAPTLGHWVGQGWRVEMRDPPPSLEPLDFTVPGDPSTGAFFVVWCLLQRAACRLRLPGVGLNPTRTGLFTLLERMGASLDLVPGDGGVEPTGEVIVEPSALDATAVEGADVPALIDEVPLVAVAGVRAVGVTSIRGGSELRHKESDRLAALAGNLRAIGVDVEEYPDGLDVHGTERPLHGTVHTYGDHRIEMAFGVLGATPDVHIEMTGPAAASVSYPGFWRSLERLQAMVGGGSASRSAGPVPRRLNGSAGNSDRRPVVVIDGPAGSGKSTTARLVARRLGLAHLDSGALYRALTLAVLRSGIPESEWAGLSQQDWNEFEVSVEAAGAALSVGLGGRPVPDADLRTPDVTARVSIVSALPAVRGCLLELQRSAARDGGLVADGRDMGSVVFPDADVKVFLVADLEERARRRLEEVGGDPASTDGLAVAAEELQRRDFRDMHREHSPLKRPEGAVTIDTTGMSLDEQVDEVVRLVREAWPDAPGEQALDG